MFSHTIKKNIYVESLLRAACCHAARDGMLLQVLQQSLRAGEEVGLEMICLNNLWETVACKSIFLHLAASP